MMEEEEMGPEEGYLLVRIHVPELNIQKCLQFLRDQLVWDVKQQCLAALPKELKESFNYGLFSPPENGKAGKFLDEERRLGDYSFNGPVGYLELKYKRRVYKMVSLDEKQLKSLHTRANLRRFLDYVQNAQVEKVTKMCSKGLDPNFHCQDSGETPLTLATRLKKPVKILIALVNGGAILDYRTRDGTTALHRSIEHKNLEALKTLLELGASPNYRDNKGLSSLYISITHNVDPVFTETLLHDHATIGAQDTQGWHEVHQACKLGLFSHLELLLFYGADMNAKNASGNSPLHVCAVNGQEHCARQLLFRGADRQALNFANQTPCQVAVIAGNMELAEMIENYREEDVVPFRGPPSYNPKRRSAIGWLNRAPSMSTLAFPPSPCPSDRSSAPFSSASSNLSDGSAQQSNETDTASIITDKSLGDSSDIISDSSGVGTANSDTTNCSLSMPGSIVVCIESYMSTEEGHISIREGELIEVTGATDDGYLEGNVRSSGGRIGIFPTHCVQEVKLRNHNIHTSVVTSRSPLVSQSSRVTGRRESTSKHFATAPRARKVTMRAPSEPRTVILHKGRKGFGFILRGAKATSPLMELTPSEKCPALQYLDDVDPGGVADMAGLRKGDFLLEINNEDVSSASHEHVVDLIRNSGDLVKMTVLSWNPTVCPILPMSKSTILPGNSPEVPIIRQYATLPRKMGTQGFSTLGRSGQAPLPPRRDPRTTLSVGRARAKSMVAELGTEMDQTENIAKTSSAESMQDITSSSTTNTLPLRTASVRQRPTSARIRKMNMEQNQEEHSWELSSVHSGSSNSSNNKGSSAKTKIYASVAEMKRSKIKNTKSRLDGRNLRRNFHSTPDLAQELEKSDNETLVYKSHHSQEDIAMMMGSIRGLPPPNHPPPPPPPQGQMVKVDVGKENFPEYDRLDGNLLEGIVSSFKPTASAKLYASPEDMKNVGYRFKRMPSQSVRPQLRKTQSLRSPPPVNSSILSNNKLHEKINPYAQPIRPSRSHSVTGREKRKKTYSNNSNRQSEQLLGDRTPPIPEPDYSCSDSEVENDYSSKNSSSLAARLSLVHLQPVENSGNSNTSGSSSGSGSLPLTLSVEEIQRGKSLLKSSKSYPDSFIKRHEIDGAAVEDGDNSSSGVSSDQEITAGVNSEYSDRHAHDHTMTLPTSKQRQQTGLLTRHAVSLVQLPPPIENENDEKEDFCLPPPPEFEENSTNFMHGEEIVVAPPPQFSDSRQAATVRIVGAVPKGNICARTQPKT